MKVFLTLLLLILFATFAKKYDKAILSLVSAEKAFNKDCINKLNTANKTDAASFFLLKEEYTGTGFSLLLGKTQ